MSIHSQIRALFTLAGVACAAFVSAQSPDIPIVSDLNIVLAVANATASDKGPAGILQGDYEMVVTIAKWPPTESRTWRRSTEPMRPASDAGAPLRRFVSAADLANAPAQILGFHLDDPPGVNAATALGPSLGVTRALVQKGTTPYSFRLWAGREHVSGTLRRSANSPVKFPVLLNGKRVELDAILATGQMALGTAKRPFETVILDHPRYPISLRIAYGPRMAGFRSSPTSFARSCVSIFLLRQPLPRRSAESAASN